MNMSILDSNISFILPSCDNESNFTHVSIYLLNPTKDFNVFEKLPRTFTITTKNGSYNFNKEILNYTSSTIRSFLISNPDKLQFKLAIIDERKVLEKKKKKKKKIAQMYQGKTVVFSKSDIPVYQKIKNNLQIQQCPNFMRSINLQAEIDPSIDSTNITNISFLTALSTQQFTNITNKNKYQCNIYGIKSSSVISEYIKNNSPQVFNYDHEDDSGEFQLICDYFKINFKNVTSIR